MSHEISVIGGRAEIAYAGELPWHRLGQKVPDNATSADAMNASGLHWTVRRQPLTMPVSGSSSLSIPLGNMAAIVRDDQWGRGLHEQAMLGFADASYVPLQNRDAFAFAEPLIEAGQGRFETAGALSHGKRVWVMVRLKRTARITPSDSLDFYLLLSNSHDGRTGIEVKLTSVRVVCNNTLTMALSQGQALNIPHDANTAANLAVARRLMSFVHQRCNTTEVFFRSLAMRQISVAELDSFLSQVFPNPTEWDDVAGKAVAQNNRRLATMLFEEGTGNRLEGVEGTLWAALNAVTELLDHRKAEPAARLESLWWGEGYQTKLRAMSAAAALVAAPPLVAEALAERAQGGAGSALIDEYLNVFRAELAFAASLRDANGKTEFERTRGLALSQFIEQKATRGLLCNLKSKRQPRTVADRRQERVSLLRGSEAS